MTTPSLNEFSEKGTECINSLIAKIAVNPADAWGSFYAVVGAVELFGALNGISPEQGQDFLKKATVARLAVCSDPAPGREECIHHLKEMIAQISARPDEAQSLIRDVEARISELKALSLLSDDEAEAFNTMAKAA